MKSLGFIVVSNKDPYSKIFGIHKTLVLAKANWLIKAVGIEVTSAWTESRVNKEFKQWASIYNSKAIEIFCEEDENDEAP